MPEDKREQLQERVNSKVHWGTGDEVVRDWLRENHGLAGAQADRMLVEAHRELRKEVRARALLGMIGSGVVFAGVAIFVGVQVGAGRFVIGIPSVMILGVGIASLGFLIRSISRFVSGRYLAPMDS